MSILTKIDRKDAKNARKFIKTAQFAMHIGSLAATIEALEEILVEKGILEPDQLMGRLQDVLQKHYSKGELIPPAND